MSPTPRTIVVTGATGITGRAVTAELMAAGHTVIAVGSDEERLLTVDASQRMVCDLTSPAATTQLAVNVREAVGTGVDGVVHLVGGWKSGNDVDSWDWLEPRLLTTLRTVTLAFHDDLSASSAGRLVTIGSASAAKPTWSGANYATLKTAADAWVAGVASGWRKAGTAAAVTLVVKSIGGEGTPPDVIASTIAPLWDGPAIDLNGMRIPL